MYRTVIEKIIEMNVDDEFRFIVCEEEYELEYSIGVKMINEFDSLLVIIGFIGGGLNMIFLANDNIVDREDYLKEEINHEFIKYLNKYKFVEICE